jgi:hypothetical protein
MMDAIDKTMEAIKLLYPNYISSSNGVYFDIDGNEITINADDVDAKIAEINSDYSRLRKAKYDLLNQDEMRYDDTKNSTTTWVDAIDAIKAAHPKP